MCLRVQASDPDLAYILVETLIFETERVALAFRAWTLLNPRQNQSGKRRRKGSLETKGKTYEYPLSQCTPTQNSCLSRVREPQSHRRLRPGRNHLPRLWPGPLPEPNEPWPRMASVHQRGKGRERTRGNTNILLHPRQRTLDGHRPSQQRRLRPTTTLRDENGDAPPP